MNMQTILREIDRQIELLKVRSEYVLPKVINANAAIQEYLEHRHGQHERIQQQQYLQDLRELVAAEILKIEVEAKEKAELAESAVKAKDRSIETAKALKQLSKLDLCSPEAASELLNLTKIRR